MKGSSIMFTRLFALQLWLAAGASFPVSAQAPPSGLAKAAFAAGCFWCTEEAMDKVPGVISTTSGYMGGSEKNPTYQEVSAGSTGHTEIVQVVYDPTNGFAETFELAALGKPFRIYSRNHFKRVPK
jgi:Peptide methionine sulfoxide reductase